MRLFNSLFNLNKFSNLSKFSTLFRLPPIISNILHNFTKWQVNHSDGLVNKFLRVRHERFDLSIHEYMLDLENRKNYLNSDHFKKLSYLELDVRDFTSDSLGPNLLSSLERHQNLCEVKLTNFWPDRLKNSGTDTLTSVLEALEKTPNIKKLTFEGQSLDGKTAQRLAELLRKNPNITDVEVEIFDKENKADLQASLKEIKGFSQGQ